MLENRAHKEFLSLIQLMDEPDEKVFTAIRKKIMEYGANALPALEEVEGSLMDEIESARVEDLIVSIRIKILYQKLGDWALFRNNDLLEPFSLISAFQQGDDSTGLMQETVNKIYRDIWLEMNDELTTLEKIRVINHVFFEVYGFQGIQNNKINLPAYLLGNVLRMQMGNPLSLAMLYLTVTQKLGLPIFGVDLPGHFILAYMDDNLMIKPVIKYAEEDVLFYVNPFNKGAVFRKSEIELFVKQLNIKTQNSYYLPCDNSTVIRRFIQEMVLIHKKNKGASRADALIYLLTALPG